MTTYTISGHILYAGDSRFTARACAIPIDSHAAAEDVVAESIASNNEARLLVYELVVALAGRIRGRGDRIEDVIVE